MGFRWNCVAQITTPSPREPSLHHEPWASARLPLQFARKRAAAAAMTSLHQSCWDKGFIQLPAYGKQGGWEQRDVTQGAQLSRQIQEVGIPQALPFNNVKIKLQRWEM